MHSTNRPSGPFREQLFFDPVDIDNICVEALCGVKCLPTDPGPIDIERFIEKHFRCESGYEELPVGVMGFTAFDKSGKVIGIRVQSSLEDGSNTGLRRVRSTWAHEGGHGLLHSVLFIEIPGEKTLLPCADSNVADNRMLCRNEDIKPVGSRYDGRWWEWQANRCIGGLLLPKTLVVKALQPYLTVASMTKISSLPAAKRAVAEAHTADLFEVSAMVARIRLSEMFPVGGDNQLTF